MRINRIISNQIETLGLDTNKIDAIDIGVYNGEKIADVKFEGEVFAHRVIVSQVDTPEQVLKSGLETICTFPESNANFVIPKIDVIRYNPNNGIVIANLRTEGFGKANEMTPYYLRSSRESIPDYLKRIVDYTNPFSNENIANTFMAYLIAVLSTRDLKFNKNEINRNLMDDLYFIIDLSYGKQEILVHKIDITDLVNIDRFVDKNPSANYSRYTDTNLSTLEEVDSKTGERRTIFERHNSKGLNDKDKEDYNNAFVEYLKSRKDADKEKLFKGKRVYSNLFGSLLGADAGGPEGKYVSPGRFQFEYLKEVRLNVSVE